MRGRNGNGGMTMIEVLAATVLASLMLSAVVGVLTGLSRQQKTALRNSDSQVWSRQLASLFDWDYKNSRFTTSTSQAVRVEGFAARDFVTGRPTGRPSIIEYSVKNTGVANALVRRETHPDEPLGDNSREEILLTSVDRIVIGNATLKAVAGVVMPSIASEPTAIPDRFNIEIFEPKNALPLFAIQLHVR
jgi:Tfp pilus assembly protein PilV